MNAKRLLIGVLILLNLVLALANACQAESVTARVPRAAATPPDAGADLVFTVQVLKPQQVTVRVPRSALTAFGGAQYFQELVGKYAVLTGEVSASGELVLTEPGQILPKPAREKRPRGECPPGCPGVKRGKMVPVTAVQP